VLSCTANSSLLFSGLQTNDNAVRKGDAFNTSCTYRNDGNHLVLEVEDEICVIFLTNDVAPTKFVSIRARLNTQISRRLFGESCCEPPVEETPTKGFDKEGRHAMSASFFGVTFGPPVDKGTSGSTFMDVSAELGAFLLT